MRFINTILLTVCINFSYAQHLSLFELDKSEYPKIQAKFYAFNESNEQQTNLTISNSTIKENGAEQKLIEVINPKYSGPVRTSVVLTLDISGSMEGENMKISQAAANAIIDLIPLHQSEVAINSFDDINNINTDFTQNKKTLQEAVKRLTPDGGTSYDEGFNAPLTGALSLAKNGQYKKSIIFLTDGLGDARMEEIVQIAKANDITIYCVTINMRTPDVLREISTQTGGQYIEYVQSGEQGASAFSQFLFKEQELQPGIVKWNSASTCDMLKNVEFNSTVNTSKHNHVSYYIPDDKRNKLATLTPQVTFEDVKPNKTNLAKATFKAFGKKFKVVEVTSSNPNFKNYTPLPWTISPSANFNASFSYKADELKPATSIITMKVEGCYDIRLALDNGYKGDKNIPIIVTAPNGNETFYTNTDTIITWTGTKKESNVQLSFSPDNGKTWDVITESGNGLEHKWKVPNTPTETGLIKADLTDGVGITVGNEVLPAKKRSVDYIGVAFSHDGSRVIYRENSAAKGKLIVLETATGEVLYSESISEDMHPSWCDENGIVRCEYWRNRTARYFDIFSLKWMGDSPISEYTEGLNVLEGLATYYKKDTVSVLDMRTNKFLSKFYVKDGRSLCVSGKYAVVGNVNTGILTVWDYTTKQPVFKKKIEPLTITEAGISADGQFLAVGSTERYGAGGKGNERTDVFNIFSEEHLYTLTSANTHYGNVEVRGHTLFAMKDGKLVVADIRTGEVAGSIPIDCQFFNMDVAPNGNGLIVRPYVKDEKGNDVRYIIGTRKTLKVIGSDISDKSFRIIDSKLTVKNFDFGNVILSESKELLLQAALVHNHPNDLIVKNIKISGPADSDFTIISNVSKGTEIAQSHAMEIRFTPSETGARTAKLIIETERGNFISELTGSATVKPYSLSTEPVNLGATNVGTQISTKGYKTIKNTGSKGITILQVVLPTDEDQFTLVNTKAKVKPGASLTLELGFNAKYRGKVLSEVSVYTKNLGVIKVPIFAEGIAPREYLLSGKLLDRTNKNLIAGEIAIVDTAYTEDTIFKQQTTDGLFKLKLNNDRVYRAAGTSENYRPNSLIVGSNDVQNNDKYTLDVLLDPISNDSERTITGKVIDAISGESIEAKISYTNLDSKLKIGETTHSKSEEKYAFNVNKEVSLHMLVQAEGYLPAKIKISKDQMLGQKEYRQDFKLNAVHIGETTQLSNVLFVRSKAELLEQSYEPLDELVQYLLDQPEVSIELAGHTDNQGNADLNLKLSDDRVETIKLYLIDHGINKKRISGKGYGGSKPIASNNREATRKLNRRVEFILRK